MENNQENKKTENRVEGEKNNLDAYSVQILNLDSREIMELNYSGTPIITTKEMLTELLRKAGKYDELLDSYNELKQENRTINENVEKIKKVYLKFAKESKELAKVHNGLQDEYKKLEKELELEKKAHFVTGQNLAKFQQLPPQKKAYLSDAEVQSIKGRIIESYKQGLKVTAKQVHEWVMREGRKRGDKRLAQISYETVRVTVNKIKVDLGIIRKNAEN